MSSGAPTADLGVSVVLPCYNRGAYLARWLEAFAWWAPYDLPVEIIVVDDGGADQAATVVDRGQARGLDIHYRRVRPPDAPRNNGQARNAGIRAARFPLILNSDPDVVFVTDVIRRLIAAWQPGTFCSVSGYFPLTRRAWLALWDESERRPLRADDYRAHLDGRQNLVHSPDDVHGLHGAFLCDRATLQRLRGYDERFYCWGWEDRDLLTRLEQGLGFTRRYVEGAIVAHQWHPTLRADDGAARSRVLWQMGWQRARAADAQPIVRNPESWGEWRGTAREPMPGTSHIDPDAARPSEIFEAYLYEAQVWRREGHPRLALERLRVAFARWWEWSGAEASDRGPLALQIALATAAGYARSGEAALEYAKAAADAGDPRLAATVLEAAASLPDMAIAIASLRARWLAEAGAIGEAIRVLEDGLAAEPLAASPLAAEAIARLAELFIRIDRPDAAQARLASVVSRGEPRLDVFERLLFDAYLVRLRQDETAGEGWPPRVAGQAAGDFLFSAAARARRAGLVYGATILFEAAAASEGDDDGLRARAASLRDQTRDEWQALALR